MPTKPSDRNVVRNQIASDFKSLCLENVQIHRVAVVGGSLDDHEVSQVRQLFPKITIDIYGIDLEQNLMNLNMPPLRRKNYDLVLCTNVLEHVFNHENFAENLLSLLEVDGKIWCCFPFNDMYHGAPLYFSAGFHPAYVESLFARHGGETLKSTIVSSKRLYLFTHLLRDWPSQFRYEHPFVGQIMWALGLRSNPRPPIRNLSPSRIFFSLILSLIPKQFNTDPNYGCASWLLVRKAGKTRQSH
jgi:hypothetical protein